MDNQFRTEVLQKFYGVEILEHNKGRLLCASPDGLVWSTGEGTSSEVGWCDVYVDAGGVLFAYRCGIEIPLEDSAYYVPVPAVAKAEPKSTATELDALNAYLRAAAKQILQASKECLVNPNVTHAYYEELEALLGEMYTTGYRNAQRDARR